MNPDRAQLAALSAFTTRLEAGIRAASQPEPPETLRDLRHEPADIHTDRDPVRVARPEPQE